MAWRFSSLPIRLRILLLVLATWLPAAALTGWLLYADARNAQEAALEKAGFLPTSARDDMQHYLQDTGALLERLARRPLIRALDPQRCDPLISEYVEMNPEFANLVVRDLAGKPVCSSLSNPIADVNRPEFPWFQQALSSTGLQASGAVFWPRTSRWVSVLTYTIRDDGGRTVGLLQLPIDLLRWANN